MKHICLLGATGSIGSQVLDIIANNLDKYRLIAFAFGENTAKATQIIKEFKPEMVACQHQGDMENLSKIFPHISFFYGENGRDEVVKYGVDNPIVINALVGSVGLLSTIRTIDYGRDILLANKESLVMAGEIIMKKAKEKGVRVIPIDSEHVAISQILAGKNISEIKRIILTSSGGALLNKTRQELEAVTIEEALKHPNWSMGAKITIDSATMMNKGFEIIEAYHLFNLSLAQIEAIIHPESLIHSLVEFNDGSLLAQMGPRDMRLSINYAINYPNHQYLNIIKPLTLNNLNLSFKTLDEARFPCVSYAKWALTKGGLYPTILNGANEALVNLFLKGKIKFNQIDEKLGEILVDKELSSLAKLPLTIENIIKVDQMVKNRINQQEV